MKLTKRENKMAKKCSNSVFRPQTALFCMILLPTMTSILTVERNGFAQGSMSDPTQVCGRIHTSAGLTLALHEYISLSPEQFENVHVEKMKGAVISPERNCAIKLCGFASWGDQYDSAYIGTTSDYSDCALYDSEATEEVDKDNYNTSSLSCGCHRNDKDCTNTCPFRASKLKWKEKECAVLFQERSYNSCYFPPVYLSNNETISTNHSLHFTSMIVREKCFVEQRVPAFARMWLFHEITQPIIYLSGPTENDILTANQDQPETFRCLCGVPVPVVPVSSSDSWAYLILGIATPIIVLAVAVWILIWKKRMLSSANDPETQQLLDDHNSKFTKILRGFQNVCSIAYLINRKCFHIHQNRSLGSGRFGTVYQGTLKTRISNHAGRKVSTNLVVAVKKIMWTGSQENIFRSFIREIKTFQKIDEGHENIVKYFGACCDRDGLFLLTEFCEGGSLENYLRKIMRPHLNMSMISANVNKNSKGYVDQKDFSTISKGKQMLKSEDSLKMITWCKEIACAMEFLHKKAIVHLDLATRNVLLKQGQIKVCDFGLAKDFFPQTLLMGDFPCNSFAPELKIGDKAISGYLDVWAFGCTVWEIFSLGELLYSEIIKEGDLTFHTVTRLLSEGYRQPNPPLAPVDVCEVLDKCWKEIPEERPSFNELCQFFENKLPEYEEINDPDMHCSEFDFEENV